MTKQTAAKAPSPLYIPHGAGPCFFMEWTMGPRDTWDNMKAWLSSVSQTWPAKPSAIIAVSAHWETPRFSVTSSAQPTLLFDYGGFPEHTYQLQYPAPGAPALASRIVKLLNAAGLPADEDPQRGFDHGVFIPFKVMVPEAAIPIVQLSLKSGLNPAEHLAAGKALAALRDEGVWIVGSGMSYHNMRGFGRLSSGPASAEFDAWLAETVQLADAAERNHRLQNWQDAPQARVAHPREEHLLPLMVVAGAAAPGPGKQVFRDEVIAVTVSALQVP